MGDQLQTVFTLGWRFIGSVLIDDASPNPAPRQPGPHRGPVEINGAYENPAYNYFDLADRA